MSSCEKNQVIDQQVVAPVMKMYGKDWTKHNYILVSDSHASHQTTDVLKHCAPNNVLPVFFASKLH
jgi:hypothetical protein